MKILQALEHPRFPPPVPDVFQAIEPRIAAFLLVRQRRHYEFKARPPIGIHEPRTLLLKDRGSSRHRTHGKIESHPCFVGFGQRETRNLFLSPPHAFEKCNAVRRCYRGSKGGEVGSLHRRRTSPAESGSKDLLQLRCDLTSL